MLALHGPVFKERNFDLVISGINRGDNAGLHVVYSGTVGAAREAACKVRAPRQPRAACSTRHATGIASALSACLVTRR